MSGLQAFDLDTLPDEPWRNGGGRTRPLASERLAPDRGAIDADSLAADWRLSVATIDRSGAFSVFAGVERHSLLVAGGPLALTAEGKTPLSLNQTGDIASYAGELTWRADVAGNAAPVQLLNLMTRRATARGRLLAVDADTVLSGQALALLVISGQWSVRDARSGQAMIRSARTGATSPSRHAPGGDGAPATPHRWALQRLTPTGLIATIEVEPT